MIIQLLLSFQDPLLCLADADNEEDAESMLPDGELHLVIRSYAQLVTWYCKARYGDLDKSRHSDDEEIQTL